MSRARRHFTNEFKCEAVRLCNVPGATVTQIAHDLDIWETCCVAGSVWRVTARWK